MPLALLMANSFKIHLNIDDDCESMRRRRSSTATEASSGISETLPRFVSCNVRRSGLRRTAQQLRRIGSAIDDLNRCVEDIRKHVSASRRETAPMFEEATSLLANKQEVETKQALLDAFKEHFILSSEALQHLTSVGTGVDAEFFALLYRLKRIHEDCQVLLESEEQQLGLELMEQSSRQLESAHQKLFKWIQGEFKTLDLENPRMNAPIRQALRVLAERPQLFQSCLDFFAEARERNLVDGFYAALVGSGTQTDDRTTKPMEYYAHEPLRFVGDMLAWTHSATVSERESLEVLFIAEGDEMARGIQAGIENEPWLRESSEVFDGKKSLEELVNRDLVGVSRALHQRIEQVIRSDEDPVNAYKIANLIGFYCTTLTRLLGSQSSILETLETCKGLAMEQYRVNTRDVINTLSTTASIPPLEWEAPEFLLDALNSLKELLKSLDGSFGDAKSREDSFQAIINESLDPFLEICESIAVKAEEPARSIFTINCLLVSKEALSSWDVASDRSSMIDDKVDECASRLIDYQHAFFLQTSGVHPLLVALAPLTDSSEDLRSIYALDAFQAQALADSSQILDDFLPSALEDATDNLKRLKDPKMAEDITGEAALRFCEDFEHVEGRIAAADDLQQLSADDQLENGTEQPTPLKAMYPRTSGELRVLLS